MKKVFLSLFAAVSLAGVANTAYSQTLLSHDFNDGRFAGFEVPKTDQEARVRIINGRIETHWDQDLYNGTNSGRKAQFRPDENGYHFTHDFWAGFWVKVHGDYMRDNTNTDAALLQIWGHDDARGSANHYAMLKMDRGSLVWQARYNSVSNFDHFEIYPDFPKDKFVRVVFGLELKGRNNGGSSVRVWIDDELMLNETGLNMGWGEMNANGMINKTYSSISFGQYNYRENSGTDQAHDNENHRYDGHQRGETRTVTYDNVSLWDGENGYDIVDPDKSNNNPVDLGDDPVDEPEIPVVTPGIAGGDFRLVKRNASGFAMDGGSGGSNGQGIELYQNINHKNLTWTEIDRGNGYYSYQKLDTDYCIDGGNGGANGQNLYLWLCSDNNQDQHWKKVDVGAGNYLLEKRNAPDYAIDGGAGGVKDQKVYLWKRNTTNQNQHWSFD